MSKVFFEYQFTGSYSRVFIYRYSIPDDVTVIANQSEKYSVQPFGTIYNSYVYLYNSNQSIRGCFFFDKSCIVTLEVLVNGSVAETYTYNCIAETNGIYTDRYPVGANMLNGYNLPFNNVIENLNTGWSYPVTVNYNAGQTFTSAEEAYNYVFNPYVQYQWSSVPAISGKNGILTLSQIRDEDLGDGNPVSQASRDVLKSLGPTLQEQLSALSTGQTADVIYSGETYKMTATKNADNPGYSVTLNFYFMPTTPGTVPSSFYSYTVSMASFAVRKARLGFIIDRDNEVAALSLIEAYTSGVDNYVNYNTPGATTSAEDMHNLFVWLMGSALPENWDDTDGLIDDEGDGGGSQDPDIYNPIPEPGISLKSAYDTGFISQYLVTKTELQNLCKFLWSDNFVDNVKKFFDDPREIIMGLTLFPLTPDHASGKTTIAAGGISTGIEGYKITKQFQRYDFGYCSIPQSFSSGIFYDFSPYTEAKIYLPYCGEHALSLNDIMGHTLHLKYSVDHISGICCAHLMIDNEGIEECHYNFTGQMGQQIPISSEDFGGFYRSMISAGAIVGGAIATVATGGLAAPFAATGPTAAGWGAAAEASSLSLGVGVAGSAALAQNMTNMGKDVSFTSGGGSISGGLSSEYPYVTLVRPKIFKENNQRHYTGYPTYGTYKLKNCTGFTKVMGIHLDGLTCAGEEREAIRARLGSGIVINDNGNGAGVHDPIPPQEGASGNGHLSFRFLQCLSDTDSIGKKFSDDSIEVNGEIFYNQDFNKIELLIPGNYLRYNYVYWYDTQRFYYVDKFTAQTGNMIRVSISFDAAETYWSELKECEALIEMSENSGKAKYLMNNSTWFMKANKKVRTYTFKNGESDMDCMFDRSQEGSTEQFILTIAGDVEQDQPEP